MFDLRKELPADTAMADLTPEQQADVQHTITQAIHDAITSGCTRIVAKDNGNGYSTLLYALVPDEDYTLLEGESFIQVPTEDKE